MATKFEQEWLTGTGTYLDDVLWPAVVRASHANSEMSESQRVAAWDAYVYYDYDGDDGMKKLYNLIRCHEWIEDLVDEVNGAMEPDDDEDCDGCVP
jgi:hypothetical protein